MDRLRVMFFCPTLGEGGADRVVAALVRHLDRSRFAPSLALVHRTGPFVADVPTDTPIFELGSRRLLVAMPDLVRLLRREQPDVLVSIHGGPNIVAAAAHRLARSRGRLVLSERSALFRGDRSPGRRWLELRAKRITYRRADVVAAVSRGVADELATVLGVPLRKLVVVDNPVIDDEIVARAAEPVTHPWFGASETIPVVLAIGRLVEIKDYPTLLDAFARILARRPARLFVLGEGPERPRLEAIIRDRGLRDAVELHGFDKNPFKYMSRARLVLHASRAEGLPGALIQALACGAPVVSTDCDFGPREVITRSGHDGFLTPVGDAAALAERALDLLADDELRARIVANGRRSIARFTVANAVAQYEAAISGVGDRK